MKLMLIFTALLAIFLFVQHEDYQDEVQTAAAEKERTVRRCDDIGRAAAQDVDGRWVCMDTAPSWAMTQPLSPENNFAPSLKR